MVRKSTQTVPVTVDGKTVQMQVAETPNYRIPHADEETGLIPEFVNISDKVQIVRVPYDDQPQTVPPTGILRGAQWRPILAEPNRKTWGDHPRFVERVPVNGKRPEQGEQDDQKWSPARGKFFDKKYLLTEEQAVKEISQLSNKDRINLLVRNAVIVDTEEVTRLGYRRNHQGPIDYENTISVCARPRAREDRPKVSDAAIRRLDWIEEQERLAQEKAGVFEN